MKYSNYQSIRMLVKWR